MVECCIEGCEKPEVYRIEWYGLNQHGKDPKVADEKPVCELVEHIREAAHHDDYGGTPDGIVDSQTLNIEYPDLLEQIIKRMDPERM